MLSGICESPGSKSPAELDCVKVNLDKYYPAFNLCESPPSPPKFGLLNIFTLDPAAYPHFDIYPALPDISSGDLQQERRIECAKVKWKIQ